MESMKGARQRETHTALDRAINLLVALYDALLNTVFCLDYIVSKSHTKLIFSHAKHMAIP